MLLALLVVFCAACSANQYPLPPQGCPWELLDCGGNGKFNPNSCEQWMGPAIWDEINVCSCVDDWIGSDCTIAQSQNACTGSSGLSVYDGSFVLPTANVTYKHVECHLDEASQAFLSMDDHRVNITLTPAYAAPSTFFNLSVVVMSRMHDHTHPQPDQWGPLIPAVWCSAAWCSVIDHPQNDSSSFVQYSCPSISCDACTPQQGNCNAIVAQVVKLITASETHPILGVFRNASVGQGAFELKTNILSLTGSCIVGQCNPWADIDSK